MIETVVVYSLFLIHWLELIFGEAVSSGIRGLSLGNLAFALAFMGWLLGIAFKRANFQWNNFFYVVLGLIWVVAMSIPYKSLHGEFSHISIQREIMNFITWIQPFILFVLVFNLAHSKSIVKKMTIALMIYVILCVAVTILAVIDVWKIGEIRIQYEVINWPRFAEPNQFAAFLVLMSPIFISYLIFGKSKYSRIATAICCSLIFFALIASGSRGGLLAFGGALITYLWLLKGTGKTGLFKGKTGLFKGVAVMLALVVVAILIVPSEVKEKTFVRFKYNEKKDLNDYSSGRLGMWEKSWRHFLQRPIFGYGQDSIRLIASTDSHNFYLTYLVNHGVIGFGIFSWMLIGLFKRGVKGMKNARDDFGIILFSGFSSGMFGLSLAIFFVNIYQFWFVVMIYATLALRYAQLDAQERNIAEQLYHPGFAEGFVKNPTEAITQ